MESDSSSIKRRSPCLRCRQLAAALSPPSSGHLQPPLLQSSGSHSSPLRTSLHPLSSSYHRQPFHLIPCHLHLDSKFRRHRYPSTHLPILLRTPLLSLFSPMSLPAPASCLRRPPLSSLEAVVGQPLRHPIPTQRSSLFPASSRITLVISSTVLVIFSDTNSSGGHQKLQEKPSNYRRRPHHHHGLLHPLRPHHSSPEPTAIFPAAHFLRPSFPSSTTCSRRHCVFIKLSSSSDDHTAAATPAAPLSSRRPPFVSGSVVVIFNVQLRRPLPAILTTFGIATASIFTNQQQSSPSPAASSQAFHRFLAVISPANLSSLSVSGNQPRHRQPHQFRQQHQFGNFRSPLQLICHLSSHGSHQKLTINLGFCLCVRQAE